MVPEMKKGTSARGEWKKKDFILETVDGAFPRKICMSLWGDKASDIGGYNIGDMITASVDISSREFNGSWYTDVVAWRVQRGQSSASPASAGTPAPPPAGENYSVGESQPDDDLPF